MSTSKPLKTAKSYSSRLQEKEEQKAHKCPDVHVGYL